MKYRKLGKTGFEVSEVSLGTWQIGASWGSVSEKDAIGLLHTAIDNGINFFDTADVYGDGRSERLIAGVLGERREKVFVATKAGRRLQPHTADGYNQENLTAFVERSLTNLKRETLDLVQLHCPPTDVYYRPEVFAALDALKQAGKILHYGVSVEKIEEAIKATEFPGQHFQTTAQRSVLSASAKTRCRNPGSASARERLTWWQNNEGDPVRRRRSSQLQSTRRTI
jgi:aryl-alcohol dehydrogenase-like predicted oxidoreductase